jgi:enamine deaminase RidA (YjgF/YER057c/UK114 family)
MIGERDDLVQVWDAVAAGLAPSRPPSTLLGVTGLGYPDQLVEIDAVASVP